jgi:hypothetical protein
MSLNLCLLRSSELHFPLHYWAMSPINSTTSFEYYVSVGTALPELERYESLGGNKEQLFCVDPWTRECRNMCETGRGDITQETC